MTNSAIGGVRSLLRLEGAAILVASLLAYDHLGGGWGTLVLCFFIPDLSFVGYTLGPRVGAVIYNIAHSLVGAVAVLAYGIVLSVPFATFAGIIWIGHIGFDRMLGYGLKYSSGFTHTHLGLIGPDRDGS
jgi:hypothetical protein